MTIYRDTWTGQFAKKETWQRSKSHGGNRYKRQHVDQQPETEEWIITFEYQG